MPRVSTWNLWTASTVLADHQSDVAFNPASVIKIATSFAALDKLGPEYHFETAFEADGRNQEEDQDAGWRPGAGVDGRSASVDSGRESDDSAGGSSRRSSK